MRAAQTKRPAGTGTGGGRITSSLLTMAFFAVVLILCNALAVLPLSGSPQSLQGDERQLRAASQQWPPVEAERGGRREVNAEQHERHRMAPQQNEADASPVSIAAEKVANASPVADVNSNNAHIAETGDGLPPPPPPQHTTAANTEPTEGGPARVHFGASNSALLEGLCEPQPSSAMQSGGDGQQILLPDDPPIVLGNITFSMPFLPTNDTTVYSIPRRSPLIGAALPRIVLLPTLMAEGIEYANLCADRAHPLRVTILLGIPPSSALPAAEAEAQTGALVRRQIEALAPLDVHRHTTREAVVTVIGLAASTPSVGEVGGGPSAPLFVSVLRISTTPLPPPAHEPPTPVENTHPWDKRHYWQRQWVRRMALHFDAPLRTEVIVPPVRLAGEDYANRAALLRAVASHAAANASAASRALVEMPPHFVFELPAGSSSGGAPLFSPRNLAALCRYEPVANDESEARAVYPYAAPFAYRGGTVRLPLGFVVPSAVPSSNGADAADAPPPPLTVVSSCRPPRVLTGGALAVDGRHYSKGGDVVLRGAARMAYVRAADAFVPFFGGVHEDSIIGAGGAEPMALEARERLFSMRRPLGSRCSSDPLDPTRVVTHIPFAASEAKLQLGPHEFRVFARVLNATALMTPYSDAIVTTKATASVAMAAIRSGVASLLGSSATIFTSPDVPSAYPNAYGELIIVEYSPSPGNARHVIAGLTQHQMLAAKGFYDIVRYTEEDVYLTRDQFLLYCSTLSYMEMRNFFINFMRFEVNVSDPGYEGDNHDVLHAYAPPAYFFVDAERFYTPRQWRFARGPEALVVQPTIGRMRMPAQVLNGTEYDAFEVNLGPKPAEVCLRSQFSRVLETPREPSVEPPLLRNWQEVHPKASTAQRQRTYDISGCYVMTKPMHSMFFPARIPRMYNGMWMVPDARTAYYFGDAKNTFLGKRTYLPGDREEVAYFRAPVVLYGGGIVLMRPYPVTSPATTSNVTVFPPTRPYMYDKPPPRPDTYGSGIAAGPEVRARYIIDRLGLVNHGGNRYLKGDANEVLYPIFEHIESDPFP